jgi:hypothetical protein
MRKSPNYHFWPCGYICWLKLEGGSCCVDVYLYSVQMSSKFKELSILWCCPFKDDRSWTSLLFSLVRAVHLGCPDYTKGLPHEMDLDFPLMNGLIIVGLMRTAAGFKFLRYCMYLNNLVVYFLWFCETRLAYRESVARFLTLGFFH